MFRNDRVGDNGGGTAILVKSNLFVELLPSHYTSSSCEYNILQLKFIHLTETNHFIYFRFISMITDTCILWQTYQQ